MTSYTQVYPGEVYEFEYDEDLKAFWAKLDAQGTKYSTEFFDGKAKVTIA